MFHVRRMTDGLYLPVLNIISQFTIVKLVIIYDTVKKLRCEFFT